jgi:hypothetical protein
MKVLDVSKTTILILNDQNKVEQLPRSPYTYTKYIVGGGKLIEYRAMNDEFEVIIKEQAAGKKFDFLLNGKKIEVADVNSVCNAINTHKENGKISELVGVWRYWFIQTFLNFTFNHIANRLDLTREGVFDIPTKVNVWVDAWTTYQDGSRLAKIVFMKDRRDPQNYQVFINGSDTAVCLTGRDECNQPWLHFVPTSYVTKTIKECEIWLFGVDPEKEQAEILSGFGEKKPFPKQ